MSEKQVPMSAVRNVTASRKRVETVCLRAHNINAVKETCYRYASRYYSQLQISDNEKEALVTFAFPSTINTEEEERVIASFHQDLLDQDLRERISEKTETIRTLIFANAFANTSLTDDG